MHKRVSYFFNEALDHFEDKPMAVKPISRILMAACMAMPLAPLTAVAQTPPDATPQAQAEARATLAEHFYELAVTLAASTRLSRPTLQMSATLLKGAVKLNPYEPRYLRILAATLGAVGDSQGAIDTWVAYRKLPDLADDRVAQMELIDLYAGRLQGNETKIAYIRKLLANPNLHEHVKAHIAAMAVPLLDQRSRKEATEMLAEARRHYPLPEVTLLELGFLPSDAAPPLRLAALLNVLRANPTEPSAIAEVADMLSSAGMTEPALTWYAALMNVHAANETGPSRSSLVNYLAERYRAGEGTVAAEQLDGLLQKEPTNDEFWFLRLTLGRSDESEEIFNQAQAAFMSRLSIIVNRIVGAPSAPTPGASGAPTPGASGEPAPGLPPAPAPGASSEATAGLPSGPSSPSTARAAAADASTPSAAPTTAPAIDLASIPLSQAIAQVKTANDPQLRDALVKALADLAWFNIYFRHKPELATGYIDAMSQLLPADHPLLRRMIGWTDLEQGKLDAARAILSPLQVGDDLAALGMYRLEDKDRHPTAAEAIGRQILARPRTGVLGAILYQATKGRGLRPQTPPLYSVDFQAQLDKFPKGLLDVIRNPRKFYGVRGEPLKLGCKLGEPMLMNVTIQNETNIDLTIGRAGLIKPVLIFDAQIRGAEGKPFLGIAQERIMGRIVLAPGESVSQVVRVDIGPLADALRLDPAMPKHVLVDAVTNAIMTPAGAMATAGGYPRTFDRMFTRSAFSLARDTARRDLFAEMNSGTPGQKITDIDLLSAYVRQDAHPNASEAEKQAAQQYIDVIDKLRLDPAPGVKIWASYADATLLTGPEERHVIEEMIGSNSWESRLLALVGGRFLPLDKQKENARLLSQSDPDSLVKDFAAALLEWLQTTEAAPMVPPAAPSDTPTVTPPPAPASDGSPPPVAPPPVTPDATPSTPAPPGGSSASPPPPGLQ